MRQWLPLVTAAMELPATELFLRLRRGQIEALGKLLPDGVEIIDFLEDQNSYGRGDFDDLEQISLGMNRRDSQALVNERVCPP